MLTGRQVSGPMDSLIVDFSKEVFGITEFSKVLGDKM